MALTHLADTSVLTRLRFGAVREVVEPLMQQGSIGRAGITTLEIGFAARNGDEWDSLMQSVDRFPSVETSSAHVDRALRVQKLLAERSQRGRKIPDLLVAAAAEEHGLELLHYDRDFDLISEVTGQPCRWVVVPGAID